jgi:S-formylglutathione hydrolase FrmB
MSRSSPRPALFLFIGLLTALCSAPEQTQAAQLEVLTLTSQVLDDNPLGAPTARKLAVFLPNKTPHDTPIPLVLYLPGWGGSSEDAAASGPRGWLGRTVDAMADSGHPVRLAVLDGRSRYGGSQFLNSTATGRYADFVWPETGSFLKKRYSSTHLLLAGHSSGAYGALILTMRNPHTFTGVVALSPDSDFEVTHKPLVENAHLQHLSGATLEAAMTPGPKGRIPADGMASLILGLCANYAPIPNHPGQFEWLYDNSGNWRPSAWNRWIASDPLTLVRENPNAFAPHQRIYLDGAQHDEFGANIGAAKIHTILRERPAPCTFYESPGHHSDRLPERLIRGLSWLLQKN